ncbi:MAG: phosphoribosylformylglycinamidine cyclo-ligase [Bifidobacteriaceae bacterium]|nr:phosphoribosylformylglycinamidine cyclo-ligase [Bifidobacteriaceae bacterium]
MTHQPDHSNQPISQTPADVTQAAAPALTYAAAGVDTAAGDQAVELMRQSLASAAAGRVIGGAGGFAGLVDAADLLTYRHPLLATSTDGVGTKVAIAQALDRHDTVGLDLVGMVVDDLAASGARPIAMTDYIACGRVVPAKIAALVSGVARGCQLTGTALAGGETAEHPGLLGVNEYDLAGAAVGVVEADAVLGAKRVQPGDRLLGLASSGVHSNGYSLVRALVAQAGWDWDHDLPDCGRPLGEELLEPTRLYCSAVLDLAQKLGPDLHALAHVTGGGLAANLARVIPPGMDGLVNRSTWPVLPIFGYLTSLGGLAWTEAEQTWNLGIGMVAVVSHRVADAALAQLTANDQVVYDIGQVVQTGGQSGDVVQGPKGINGGRVILSGAYTL